MSWFKLLITFLVAYECCVDGRILMAKNVGIYLPDEYQVTEFCNPPAGGSGTCKSIYECPQLFELVNKPQRTQAEVDLLTASKCGFDGNIPKVCCQNACYTPDGQPGKCVSIYSCPHLAQLLKPPVPQESINYVQNSKCNGRDQYSVCCGPPRENVVVPGNCAASVNAYPPDPKSECCGVDSRVGNKIVGGTATSVDQYPWLTIIEYAKSNQIKLLCGGALISGKYVLTAGHCVTGPILAIGTPKNVRLSEYDTSNDGPDCTIVEANGQDCTDGVVIIPIEQTIPHPEYNKAGRQGRNDIALIRLARTAPWNDFIRPICLPTVDMTLNPPPPENFTLFAAGWGAVSERQPSSNVKLHVDLPYVSREQCQPAYRAPGRNVALWEGQICAGGQAGKDSCKGDSGGPLMYENGRTYEVIGVVSFGPKPCGLEGIPGVYTKVYEYNSWIRSNIRP